MGRQPCCEKVGLKKGPWTSEEDKKLISFILTNGHCCWRALPKLAGLLRCGKSCRLRWTNYLRPDLKRGLLSEKEEQLVIDLHAQIGNRWSKIASHLPGRTDNEIKNHWNTHIKKKLRKLGIDPLTHKPLSPNCDDQTLKTQEQEQSCNSNSHKDNQESQRSTSQKSTIGPKVSTMDGGDGEDSLKLMDGFCIDEVPLIQPHEMLGPSSSSSSSCSSTNSWGSINAFLEDNLQFPDFDWSYCGVDDNSNNNFLEGSLGINVNDFISNNLDLDDQESSWVYGML